IWRNPVSHRQSLSVNGGSERITYYSLMSYRGEQGSYKSLEHGKFNLRSNVSATINESISIDLNLSAYQQNGDLFYKPVTDYDDLHGFAHYRVTSKTPKKYSLYEAADATRAYHVACYVVL